MGQSAHFLQYLLQILDLEPKKYSPNVIIYISFYNIIIYFRTLLLLIIFYCILINWMYYVRHKKMHRILTATKHLSEMVGLFLKLALFFAKDIRQWRTLPSLSSTSLEQWECISSLQADTIWPLNLDQ